LERFLESSQISQRFLSRSFATFEADNGTVSALGVCVEWASKYPPVGGLGVALFGPVGCGKTHLVAAVANELLRGEIPVLFVAVPELLADLRAAMNDGREVEQVIRDVRDFQVLILDDLGSERPTGWTREQLFRLINHRYEQLLPVLLTSNLDPGALRSQVGDRTVSRLVEMCEWVELVGPDYRALERKG
jgi:DNA replication protein DnaC